MRNALIRSIFIAFYLISMHCMAGGPVSLSKEVKEINAFIAQFGVEKALKMIAQEISKNAPIQLDSVTILDSSIAFNKRIYNRYSIDGQAFAEMIVSEFSDQVGDDDMKVMMTHRSFEGYLNRVLWIVNANNNCTNDIIYTLLDYDATIQHTYYTEGGEKLFDHIVDISDCRSLPTLDQVAEDFVTEVYRDSY